MMLIGAVAGIVSITAMQVLEIPALNLLDVAKILNWILLFVPFYSLSKGVYDLSSIEATRKVCSKMPNLDEVCMHNKTLDCCSK